jgi:N-acetylmuramoyl-L-alanine amidase
MNRFHFSRSPLVASARWPAATIGRRLYGAGFALFLALASFGYGQKTIVIDAGHGGFDRGGVPGQRISEKDKALDVAQRLKRILQAQGYRVVMTRDSDVFIPLGTRCAIANNYRGASFISIHFNCASRVGANGIETYYYRSDSASLAASIHRNVVSISPSENRGIRRRGFYVLRRTAIPSVLVECGFLTNPTEGRLALSPEYRQSLAEQIARGINRQAPSSSKPLTASLRSLSLGNDFVRVPPERSSRKSSKSRKSKKSKKSSESDKPKKKKKKKKSED